LGHHWFGDKTVSVFNEVAQDLEGLRTQLNVAIRSPQGAAPDIQRISLELKHLEAALRRHSRSRLAMTCAMSARLLPLSGKLHGSVRTAASLYALLAELIDFATQPQFVYRHKWHAGDLVIWGNRWTMHRATPFEATDHVRDMRRTTLVDTTPHMLVA
jgi:hypothetical protein